MTDPLPETMRDIPADGGTARRLNPLEVQKLETLAQPIMQHLMAQDPMTALKLLALVTANIMMAVRINEGDSRTALFHDYAKGIAATIANEVADRARRPM